MLPLRNAIRTACVSRGFPRQIFFFFKSYFFSSFRFTFGKLLKSADINGIKEISLRSLWVMKKLLQAECTVRIAVFREIIENSSMWAMELWCHRVANDYRDVRDSHWYIRLLENRTTLLGHHSSLLEQKAKRALERIHSTSGNDTSVTGECSESAVHKNGQ